MAGLARTGTTALVRRHRSQSAVHLVLAAQFLSAGVFLSAPRPRDSLRHDSLQFARGTTTPTAGPLLDRSHAVLRKEPTRTESTFPEQFAADLDHLFVGRYRRAAPGTGDPH